MAPCGCNYKPQLYFSCHRLSSLPHFLPSGRQEKPAMVGAEVMRLESLGRVELWCFGHCTLKEAQPHFVELLHVVFLQVSLLKASTISFLATVTR